MASKKKGDPADAIIDPKGDSIIILKHPSTTFAPWYEEHERRSTLSRNNTATPQDNMNASMMSVGTPSPKDEFVTAKSFLASSRHLQLASARLREILKKAGKNDNGLHVIEVDEEWTFKVFLRFVLIIHNRNFHEELKNIGDAKMDTMAELLTLAGSYGSQEALRFYIRCWELNFDPRTTPTYYSRDLVLSIYVRWVQKFKATFETLTGMAMQTMKYDRPMQTLGLPLPEAIARKLRLTAVLVDLLTECFRRNPTSKKSSFEQAYSRTTRSSQTGHGRFRMPIPRSESLHVNAMWRNDHWMYR